MSLNPIKQIYQFNKEAGFLAAGVNPWLEATFQIEEALEGYDATAISLDLFPEEPLMDNHRDIARRILGNYKDVELAPVDILDKSIDAIIFAVGAIAKQGLDPNQITRAINIVMKANLQKLKQSTVDAEGKLEKPKDFVGPEAELQRLLDSIA